MHYEPKKLTFDEDVLDINDVKIIASGKRNYTIVTNDNQLLIWGNVIKLEQDEQPDMDSQSEGFSSFNGNRLFDDATILQMEVKNNIFGAVVQD